jgi:hypothetical protein
MIKSVLPKKVTLPEQMTRTIKLKNMLLLKRPLAVFDGKTMLCCFKLSISVILHWKSALYNCKT